MPFLLVLLTLYSSPVSFGIPLTLFFLEGVLPYSKPSRSPHLLALQRKRTFFCVRYIGTFWNIFSLGYDRVEDQNPPGEEERLRKKDGYWASWSYSITGETFIGV